MQSNSGASSTGYASDPTDAPTDNNVTKAVLVVTTAILVVALIFLAHIYYANRAAAGQGTIDDSTSSDFETPEYAARKTFAYQIPSGAVTNNYNNNNSKNNIGNNNSNSNSSSNSKSNNSNNTRKPSSGRSKSTKSEDNKTNNSSARSVSATTSSSTISYNNVQGKNTTTTSKNNNYDNNYYNNNYNSSIHAIKSNHKAAKNTGNKAPLTGRLWRSGKPGETDHMAGHYRNHSVLQEFYSPIDTDERPTYRRNLFADDDDGIGARGQRSRSRMKSDGSKAGGGVEFSSSDTPSRYINQSTESPITTTSSSKNSKINSVDNSSSTSNFDSSSSSSRRSSSREKSTVKRSSGDRSSNEDRVAERDRYELLMADAREESADTSAWALELMKKAITTPAVLVGCGVLVEGHGLGRVVGLLKRPFQATLICVEVSSTGQVVNLDLLRRSSENDDTKGSIPFKIIRKP